MLCYFLGIFGSYCITMKPNKYICFSQGLLNSLVNMPAVSAALAGHQFNFVLALSVKHGTGSAVLAVQKGFQSQFRYCYSGIGALM